jgi:hypothetical protein
MSWHDGITEPPSPIRCVFPDARPSSVRMHDIYGQIPSLVLQSVADGRVSVYLNSAVVVGTFKPLIENFLSYFASFNVHRSYTIGGETLQIEDPFVLPEGCQSITLSISAPFQCTASFSVVPQLPADAACPIMTIGFPEPRDARRLEGEFQDFVAGRVFPALDVRAVSRQRVRLESRNRDYLLQTARARQALAQRYGAADQALAARAEQIAVLAREVELLTRPRPAAAVRAPPVERTIERIDRAINEVAAATEKLKALAEGKADGRKMTRREELALLETLKNQVRETRQQLDALKEQRAQ